MALKFHLKRFLNNPRAENYFAVQRSKCELVKVIHQLSSQFSICIQTGMLQLTLHHLITAPLKLSSTAFADKRSSDLVNTCFRCPCLKNLRSRQATHILKAVFKLYVQNLWPLNTR